MHLFTKVMGPLKEEMMIITMNHFTIPPKVIPAYEYHIYTIHMYLLSVGVTLPPPQKKNQTAICIGHHSLCTTSFIFIFFTLWSV